MSAFPFLLKTQEEVPAKLVLPVGHFFVYELKSKQSGLRSLQLSSSLNLQAFPPMQMLVLVLEQPFGWRQKREKQCGMKFWEQRS